MRMVALYWVNYGPYHVARGRAVEALFSSRGIQVRFLEGASVQNAYPWTRSDEALTIETLFPGRTYESLSSRHLRQALRTWLAKNEPDCVVVCGYGVEGRAALGWARQQTKAAVLMSESRYDEFPRWRVKEWVKSQIVRGFDAAVVGGRPQADYLARLGMVTDRLPVGYAVVDNNHFASRSEVERNRGLTRGRELGLPARYFLIVARFIAAKNIQGFLQAYSVYRGLANGRDWDVVICGSGPLEDDIRAAIDSLQLEPYVHLVGFKSYEEMPAYYAFASCLVLPSMRDTWGLVVNEAMASGLPVLVSQRCGCAQDLIEEGGNGFVFDPRDTDALAQLMCNMSSGEVDLRAMGAASKRIISCWSPRLFAESLWEACRVACSVAKSRVRQLLPNPFLWF